MSKKFVLFIALSLIAVFLSSGIVFAAPAPKVDVCHQTGTGSYVLISVSGNAYATHVAHGDAMPGEAVPDMDGYVFDDACVPVPAPVPDPVVLLEGSYDVVSSAVEIENLAGLDYEILDNGDGTVTFNLWPTLFNGSPVLKALTVGIVNEAGTFSQDITYGSSDGTPPDDELVSVDGGVTYSYTAPAGSLPPGEVGIFLMVNGRAPDDGNDLQRWIGITPMTTANDFGGFDWTWANRFKITLP